MVIMTAVVSSGVVYAGVCAYRKYRRRRTPVWLIENGRSVESYAVVVEDSAAEMEQLERRVTLNLNLATFSMGLTLVGVVMYEPLILVALPFNIYDAIMMFEDCWSIIFEKSQTWLFTGLSSVIVALMLITHMHLLASVLEWLYFLNQKMTLVMMRLAPLYGYSSAPQPDPVFV